MVKQLKQLLLDIAGLSAWDKRWILQQLNPEQQEKFSRLHGFQLLKDARRFRKLKCPERPVETSVNLPDFCRQLALEFPLYAAIIIDQSADGWSKDFLATLDEDNRIKQALDIQVPDLKPTVKEALFKQWEKSISFDDYLDEKHG